MLAWLAPLVVFGLVIFVHELGHFLAAKAMGVYAPRFSIGFGPALWRRRRGETEYVIAALPLGGYVRMASRDDEATAFLEGGTEEGGAAKTADDPDWDPEAMMPFGPRPVPEHRWFESKSLLARLFILIAGVSMNAVLAIVMSTSVFAVWGRAYVPAVVDSVVPNQPAQAAGVLRGDSIAAIDGVPITRWSEVIERVSAAADRDIEMEVVRDGSLRTLTLRPAATDFTDPFTGQRSVVGRVGLAPVDRQVREPMPLGASFAEGWNGTWRMAGSIVVIVRGLFTGDVPTSTLGGPVAIARVSVEAARGGVENLMLLIAFLSINIAVLNLLPVPIFDGGQILINVLEAAKGSPFSVRTREIILRVGLLAIVMLFVLVMFNDLRALFQ
jgi:regulator of sigma E protease